jgi:hypothetical protein
LTFTWRHQLAVGDVYYIPKEEAANKRDHLGNKARRGLCRKPGNPSILKDKQKSVPAGMARELGEP